MSERRVITEHARATCGTVPFASLLICATLTLCLSACRRAPYPSALRQPGRTEAILFATVHRHHFATESEYPAARLEQAIRLANPDVIAAEIPPGILQEVLTAALDEAAHPWLDSHPEQRALLRYAHEREIRLYAASAWTPARTAAWQTYWASTPEGPDELDFQRTFDLVNSRLKREGLSPNWVHSAEHDALQEWRAGVVSSYIPELGVADPLAWAQAHARYVNQIVAAHPGERIAVVFGHRRMWRIRRAIRSLGNVAIVDPRRLFEDIE